MKTKFRKLTKRTREARGLEMILLDELKNGGCPVCSTTAAHDQRYFSWFTIETYHEPAFLERFEASFGFCRRHGASLDEQGQLGSQLTFVHDYIARETSRRLFKYLSGEEKDFNAVFPDLDGCPVCSSAEKTTTRTVWFFNKLLEEGRAFSDYGHPGMLCFPHFQALARMAAPAVLHRLISLHNTAIGAAVNDMDHAQPSQIQAGMKSDVCKRGLHLAVGSPFSSDERRYVESIYCEKPDRDPVTDFEASLKERGGCPVCLEEHAAMSQWINWLNEKIHSMDNLDAMLDVLPTCREHVRACLHIGQPPLQFAAIYAALKAAQTKTLAAAKQLTSLEEKHGKPLQQRFKKRHRNTDVMGRLDPRMAVTSMVRCPLCARLKVAKERAFDLLFALLEELRYRRAFEDGYGLCVKHFVEAAKRAPSHDICTFLARVESAKLARLTWELDETMRKTAWDTRPESRGSEQSAWHSAIARFSGLPGGRGK